MCERGTDSDCHSQVKERQVRNRKRDTNKQTIGENERQVREGQTGERMRETNERQTGGERQV